MQVVSVPAHSSLCRVLCVCVQWNGGGVFEGDIRYVSFAVSLFLSERVLGLS